MSLFEIVTLLTDPPGSLIYHLTVSMTLGVILSLALIYRSRLEDQFALRWIIASGGLLGIRLLLLLLDGLIWIDVIEINNMIATMDRVAGLVGLLVFIFLLNLPNQRLSRWFMLGSLALTLLAILSTPFLLNNLPQSGPLNGTGIDLAWSFLSLIIALMMTISLVTLRPRGWDLSVSPFAILSLGILLHIASGSKTSFAPGYVRLADIAAYPLFAALTAKALASAQAEIVFEAKELFETPPNVEVTTLMVALSDLASIINSSDQSQLAYVAVETIARRMNSDYCLMLVPYENEEKLAIVTGFDLFQDKHIPRALVQSNEIPLISDALRVGKSLIIQKEFSAHELRALNTIIPQGISGPTLFVPISSGARVLGGFLLISHSSRQLWSSKDRETMELLASLIFQRFNEIKRADEKSDVRIEQEKRISAERRIQALEEAISTYRSEERSVPQEDLESLLTMHENDQKEIDRLKTEIARLLSEPVREAPSDDDLEVKQLLGERMLALQELAETRESLSQIEKRISSDPSSRIGPLPDVEKAVSIAQELSQPMSSILGYTDLLLSESVGLLGSMQQKFLQRIKVASERMGTQINSLIRVCAAEVTSLSFTHESVEVMHCLEDAINQVSSQLQEKRISLRMDIPETHFALVGDEDAIIQVFYYLLDNALGASPEESEVVIIMRKQAGEPQNFLMISVADSGPGIPAKDIQRVFQRVYSEDKASIQGIDDEGVGLSIVKSISENLGGRVWVDSEVGTGSVFTILLPLAE
jgi:nitrogen-specific signal transduction histidine kinase